MLPKTISGSIATAMANKFCGEKMLNTQLLAVGCAVLLGVTIGGSPAAAEQRPDEMIVAMASSKSICGGNTGRLCPGSAPVATPPVAASPVIPAPKPSTPA